MNPPGHLASPPCAGAERVLSAGLQAVKKIGGIMVERVFITGAAGLVGQNLIPVLKRSRDFELVAVDKHAHNLEVLRKLHPDIEVIEADLAERGAWRDRLASCERVIFLHAQIGGVQAEAFERNNITATRACLEVMAGAAATHLVHVSSSVVNSMADDFYTRSKSEQEALVGEFEIDTCVLRPTLMFGWFDRKHLGWLRRFMERAPVFPIPGDGRYLRQPLYAGDFSAIVAAALEKRVVGHFNISGQDRVDYIDIIRKIKAINSLQTPIVTIPYQAFWLMLASYALFDKNPPFTTAQLKALATPDEFEVIDWPSLFGVRATPIDEALAETFQHPDYSKIELKF